MVHIGPQIPFDNQKAFYPLSDDLKSFFYSWEECTRKFLFVCTKWEWKEYKIEVEFKDIEQAKWLYSNDFGLKERQGP